MYSEQEKALRKYIRPSRGPMVAAIIFMAFALLFLLLGAGTSGEEQGEPINLAKAPAEIGDYARLDIVAVSDWVFEYDDDVYYTVMDEEGYFYTVQLYKSQFKDLADYYDYWNETDPAVPAPAPVTLEGTARKAGKSLVEAFTEVWELSGTEEYYAIFGEMYLDATSTPAESEDSMWSFWTILMVIFGVIYCTMALVNKKRMNGFLDRLESQGALEAAAADFAAPETEQLLKDKVRMGELGIYGKGTGVAVRYEDILWAYRQVNRYYFIPVGDVLIINTKEQANIRLAPKKHAKKDQHDEINELLIAISRHNPDALLGHTAENIKAYKELKKA